MKTFPEHTFAGLREDALVLDGLLTGQRLLHRGPGLLVEAAHNSLASALAAR
jgi:hypothetical protein